ncbi:lipoprotein LpqH [Mycolicibacterium sp. XJ870]
MRHTARSVQRSRRRRLVTVTAAALLTVLSACSTANSDLLGNTTARVAINGQDTSRSYPVRCNQLRWLWTIETLPEEPGFTAVIRTGGPATPELVTIRDLAGFTGTTSFGPSPGSEASMDGSDFTVSGTAHGTFASDFSESADAEFRITADC